MPTDPRLAIALSQFEKLGKISTRADRANLIRKLASYQKSESFIYVQAVLAYSKHPYFVRKVGLYAVFLIEEKVTGNAFDHVPHGLMINVTGGLSVPKTWTEFDGTGDSVIYGALTQKGMIHDGLIADIEKAAKAPGMGSVKRLDGCLQKMADALGKYFTAPAVYWMGLPVPTGKKVDVEALASSSASRASKLRKKVFGGF